MPHNWASAEFIRLVRHLLVFERGDDLELLPAVPKHWLATGKSIRVESTPTRFGRVDLHVEAEPDRLVISFRRHPGHAAYPARTPARVLLHLPDGTTRSLDREAETVEVPR